MIKRKPRTKYEKKLFHILDEIDNISRVYGFIVFAVGGFCRDEVLGKIHQSDSDIDLMAENYSGLKLAGILSEHFNSKLEFHHRTNTAKLNINGIDFDFQANLKTYDYLPEIRKTGLPQNNFTFNMLSRDFTFNSMALSLRSGKLYDVSGMGVSDLKNGIVRTPIDPEIVLKSNPVVAFRAIKFASRFNFEISQDLKDAIKNNMEHLNSMDKEKSVEIIQDALKYNKARTINLLKELNLKV